MPRPAHMPTRVACRLQCVHRAPAGRAQVAQALLLRQHAQVRAPCAARGARACSCRRPRKARASPAHPRPGQQTRQAGESARTRAQAHGQAIGADALARALRAHARTLSLFYTAGMQALLLFTQLLHSSVFLFYTAGMHTRARSAGAGRESVVGPSRPPQGAFRAGPSSRPSAAAVAPPEPLRRAPAPPAGRGLRSGARRKRRRVGRRLRSLQLDCRGAQRPSSFLSSSLPRPPGGPPRPDAPSPQDEGRLGALGGHPVQVPQCTWAIRCSDLSVPGNERGAYHNEP